MTEQTQKVLDTITGNRMADMQNQINQLQLSQALCGVVRYPNTFAYNAGPSSTVLTLSTAAGTAIPLGTTIRRFGCNAVLSGNGVLLKGHGYFDVDASVTFTPTAAGAYTVTLFKDGVAVPGATQTITAAAAGTVSVNIPAIVRNQCCDSTSTLTLVITSATVPATVTIDNTAVVVTKI